MKRLTPNDNHERTPTESGHALPAAAELDWAVTVEELRTAEEELRQQNEALAAAGEELRAAHWRYQELFNFAPDPYLETDPAGVIREANQAAGALLGARPQFLTGKPLRAFVAPERRAGFDDVLNRLRHGLSVNGEETLLVPRLGAARPVSVHVGAAHDAAGRLAGLRWMLHDLTDLKEAQRQASQTERLAVIGQTVAVLAHESRNALQRGQACLRLLELEVAGQSQALDYVRRIQTAHDMLHRLFEDVRAFASPLRLECRPCDLGAVWRSAWEQLEPQRRGRDYTLEERADGVNLTCPGDEFRLEQVFRNLLDNALAAAADPPRVAVAARESDLRGRPGLVVTVEDNGPGLTAEQRARLFEPFFSTKAGGMGLGMAVSRRIVEAHGGLIWVAPADGGGTAVSTLLPRYEP
jgi:PAS domain S-box-containing protein